MTTKLMSIVQTFVPQYITSKAYKRIQICNIKDLSYCYPKYQYCAVLMSMLKVLTIAADII